MTVETARRRYRHLLRIAPSRLRDRHAAEMEQAFLLAWRQARSAGRFASLTVWARAIGDLTLAALREPFGRRQRGVPSEKRSWMLGTDLRYALRSFRRQRMASGLVVLMLDVADRRAPGELAAGQTGRADRSDVVVENLSEIDLSNDRPIALFET